MPGFDKSGPQGQGSRSGKQQGKCKSKDVTSPESGFGMNRGMGRGIGQAACRATRPRSNKGLRLGWAHNSGRC